MIGRAETVTIGGPERRTLLAVVLVLALGIAVAVVAVVRHPDAPASAPVVPSATATVGPSPDADVVMHDIWASSLDNLSVDVPDNSWVMTDFPVTLPYIRSVEVGVAPAGFGGGSSDVGVVLRVLNQAGQEIAQGGTTIVKYRAKYVFSNPVDVRAYVGSHLYLQLYDVSGAKVRAFFTRDDRKPEITSYVPCPNRVPAQCPNPRNIDLDALVIGRAGTW